MTLSNSDIGLALVIIAIGILVALWAGKEQGRAQAKVIEKRSLDGHWTVDNLYQSASGTSASFIQQLPKDVREIKIDKDRLSIEVRAYQSGNVSLEDLAKSVGITDYGMAEAKA